MRRILNMHLVLAVAACAFAVACSATGESPFDGGKIDFELTGTVRETKTEQPLEGAYVIAVYTKLIVGPGAVTSWCIKTKGMYTGTDGKFHFPVERRDGRSPYEVNAIKKGYFRGRTVFPGDDEWRKQDAKAYSGRDLYLTKQDPANPDFRFGGEKYFCHHAPTREAAAAAVEFLKMALDESIAYGKKEQGIRSFGGMIETLQSLPSEANTSQ